MAAPSGIEVIVHKAPVLLSVAAVASVSVALQAQVLPIDRIAEIKIKPVKCKYTHCLAAEKHGDVIAKRIDGRDVTLGHDALDAKLAQDDVAGWTTGKHVQTQDGMQFSNDHLVVYKGSAKQAEFTTGKGIIEAWRFVDGAKQVATKSRGLHGPASVELFDIATKRRVAAMQGFEINDKSPEWAKPFRE